MYKALRDYLAQDIKSVLSLCLAVFNSLSQNRHLPCSTQMSCLHCGRITASSICMSGCLRRMCCLSEVGSGMYCLQIAQCLARYLRCSGVRLRLSGAACSCTVCPPGSRIRAGPSPAGRPTSSSLMTVSIISWKRSCACAIAAHLSANLGL